MTDITNTNTADLATRLQQEIAGASGWFDGKERERFCEMMPLAKELVKRAATTSPALHSDSTNDILTATIGAWGASLKAVTTGNARDVLASNKKISALIDVIRPYAQDDSTREMFRQLEQEMEKSNALANTVAEANANNTPAAPANKPAKPFGLC